MLCTLGFRTRHRREREREREKERDRREREGERKTLDVAVGARKVHPKHGADCIPVTRIASLALWEPFSWLKKIQLGGPSPLRPF